MPKEERNNKFKEGQDDNFIAEAKTEICNRKLKALCCPVSAKTYLIILGFRFQEIKSIVNSLYDLCK